MIVRRNTERGLIKMIIVFLAVLLFLAYFGLNLRSIVDSRTFQDNWTFLAGMSKNIWNNYLKECLDFVWNVILHPILYKSLGQINQIGQGTSSPAQVLNGR